MNTRNGKVYGGSVHSTGCKQPFEILATALIPESHLVVMKVTLVDLKEMLNFRQK